ncbi:hypothetical protein FSARC_5202 [Fusarium sarcochroum]|uniref:Uncharacterized protein n=1 Tax=Fusarium sarcochroum TaxID=1208366 RepID=A0A8H4U0D0_9HYPO|nr:hypothetical protein FSARC_5202 [Fusarium sarcochroum]
MPRLFFLILGVLGVFFRHAAGNPSYGSKEMPIPGIDTNNVRSFQCPRTTHAHLNQDHLQAAMNDFAYLFYTKKMSKQHLTTDGKDAAIKALKPLFGSKDNTFELKMSYVKMTGS